MTPDIQPALESQGYLAADNLSMALHIAMQLERPLLLEGDAGVGKTELAKALATHLNTELIRLQCYEGLDAHHALYEWNYPKQLLTIRSAAAEGKSGATVEQRLFGEEFLIERPLLKALQATSRPVLLIDEIDRADEAFEAFLLEVLSDFQISIPELGTIRAKQRPFVILTANGTRDLSDALRRRCIYSYLDYPDRHRELAILHRRIPDADTHLLGQITHFVHSLREESLEKKPGIAETIDFAAAIAGLGLNDLSDNPALVHQALVTLLKTQADLDAIAPEVSARLAGRA
ncbi:MAG: MoxR family ATPase [Gammaproteobacteria bacterium]|nr:MoxR family ATPase [Gammaproteobacteria bacterium]